MIKGFEKINIDGKKGVLLDLDNTLYPYDIHHTKATQACAQWCQKKYNLDIDTFHQTYKDARKEVHELLKFQAASHSRLLYFQHFHELLHDRSSASFALELEDVYWTTFLEDLTLFDEARDFLIKVKTAGLKTCIVTDLTAQIQMQKWIKLQLDDYIDYLVSSEEAGIEKPNQKMFELALQKLNLRIEDVLMIGDSEKKDIAGAKALGIDAYLVIPETTG